MVLPCNREPKFRPGGGRPWFAEPTLTQKPRSATSGANQIKPDINSGLSAAELPKLTPPEYYFQWHCMKIKRSYGHLERDGVHQNHVPRPRLSTRRRSGTLRR